MMLASCKLLVAITHLACADAHFGSRGGGGMALVDRARAYHNHRRSRSTNHHPHQYHRDAAIIAGILRGGGDGIEENPEYEESKNDSSDSDDTDDESTDDESSAESDDGIESEEEDDSDSEDCSDSDSDEDDDSNKALSVLSKFRRRHQANVLYKHRRRNHHSKSKKHSHNSRLQSSSKSKSSKSKKSLNKHLLKFAKRNQLNLYVLFAIFAFRKDIWEFLQLLLPTRVDPVTGKRTINIGVRSIRWSTDLPKLILVGIFVERFVRWYSLSSDNGSDLIATTNKGQDGDNAMKNQTQPMEQQSSPPRKPIVPLLLILSLFLVPSIRRNFTMFSYFLLPVILKSLNGESDPENNPLGKLFLMFGIGEGDQATRMAYLPPLEQHYAFEQLNERYVRDWGAWRKAFPPNAIVTPPSTGNADSMMGGANGANPLFASGMSMTSLASALIGRSPKKSPPPTTTAQTIPSNSQGKTNEPSSIAKQYPNQYNNGTVIVLDMTNLDVKVSKMESIRDQISFLTHLVQHEDSSYFSERTSAEQQSTDESSTTVDVNATNLNANATEALPSTNNDTLSNTSESKIGQSTTTLPTIEVIILLSSPGGGVSQYGLAASHLQRLRDTANIKLTICIDEVAASGGYMMACMSSPGQLYCAPFAIVGSIGVIGQTLNAQKALENYGIKPYIFRGGKMKNPVGMVGEVTKEGMAAMQEGVERIHVAFREHVASARKEAFEEALLSDAIAMPVSNYFQLGGSINSQERTSSSSASVEHVLDQVATGDIFLGTQALKLGLVDRLITSDEYIAERIQQGSRVLKLVKYHRRQPAGLASLLAPPGHPLSSAASSAGKIGMVSLFKRAVFQMTSTLLTWADDGFSSATSSSVPSVSAGGVIDDFHIR